MNREAIIRMAREAGFDLDGMANMLYTVRGNYAQLERFAALVAAAEREACEKVAAEHGTYSGEEIAAAIRARGQA
jgi:hypothetical protein